MHSRTGCKIHPRGRFLALNTFLKAVITRYWNTCWPKPVENEGGDCVRRTTGLRHSRMWSLWGKSCQLQPCILEPNSTMLHRPDSNTGDSHDNESNCGPKTKRQRKSHPKYFLDVPPERCPDRYPDRYPRCKKQTNKKPRYNEIHLDIGNAHRLKKGVELWNCPRASFTATHFWRSRCGTPGSTNVLPTRSRGKGEGEPLDSCITGTSCTDMSGTSAIFKCTSVICTRAANR